jgi:hypothetical protein
MSRVKKLGRFRSITVVRSPSICLALFFICHVSPFSEDTAGRDSKVDVPSPAPQHPGGRFGAVVADARATFGGACVSSTNVPGGASIEKVPGGAFNENVPGGANGGVAAVTSVTMSSFKDAKGAMGAPEAAIGLMDMCL